MALKWADPGGSATGGTQMITAPAVRFTAQTSVVNGQAYAYLLDTGNPAAGQTGKSGMSVLQAAGNRISMFVRYNTLPSLSTGMRIFGVTPAAGATTLLVLSIGTDGLLRLYTNNVTTILGAAGGTTLAANTWYRVALSYAIVTTTNWSAKVYVDGVLEMTRTNADGTLSSAVPGDIVHNITAGTGNDRHIYLSDIYVDDVTDQSDPGNVRVTAKQPTTNTTNGWDTVIGTGAVNERPVSTTNGWSHVNTTDVDQDYDIQGPAVGDANLDGALIIGSFGWIWATVSSLTGNPSSNVIFNGALEAGAWDPAVAGTAQFFISTILTSAVYPNNVNGKNVGSSSSVIAADTLLYDCGVILAYIPGVPIPPGLMPDLGMTPDMQAAMQTIGW